MTDVCLLCNEPVLDDEPSKVMPCYLGSGKWQERQAHVECLLRSVTGGIGHLEDHGFWCLNMHDPDAGRSYRASARAVAVWVREHPNEAQP